MWLFFWEIKKVLKRSYRLDFVCCIKLNWIELNEWKLPFCLGPWRANDWRAPNKKKKKQWKRKRNFLKLSNYSMWIRKCEKQVIILLFLSNSSTPSDYINKIQKITSSFFPLNHCTSNWNIHIIFYCSKIITQGPRFEKFIIYYKFIIKWLLLVFKYYIFTLMK